MLDIVILQHSKLFYSLYVPYLIIHHPSKKIKKQTSKELQMKFSYLFIS